MCERAPLAHTAPWLISPAKLDHARAERGEHDRGQAADLRRQGE